MISKDLVDELYCAFERYVEKQKYNNWVIEGIAGPERVDYVKEALDQIFDQEITKDIKGILKSYGVKIEE